MSTVAAEIAANAAYELVVVWPDGDRDAVYWGPRWRVEWVLVNLVNETGMWDGRFVTRAFMRPSHLIMGVVDA